LPKIALASSLVSVMALACRPTHAISTMGRPAAVAVSMVRVWPATMTAHAWSRPTGMPRLFAMELPVPRGMMPSATSSRPTRTDAAAETVPSPPEATSTSTPLASAASASDTGSRSAETSCVVTVKWGANSATIASSSSFAWLPAPGLWMIASRCMDGECRPCTTRAL
jgi:hypothetical protein